MTFTCIVVAQALLVANACGSPPPLTDAPSLAISADPDRPRATALADVAASSVPADTIPQHALRIFLNYADRRLEVEHRVRVANSSEDAWSEILFAAPQAHYRGVFALQRVEIARGRERVPANSTLDGTMLTVRLPSPLLPDDMLQIWMTYTLLAPSIDENTWLPRGNFGADEHLLQAGDWHLTLVPYVNGVGWQTWAYHEVGDPHIYPLADYEVEILAPSNIVIAAPGRRLEQGRSRIYYLERARSFAFLASPEYQIVEGSSLGIPIRVYHLPGLAAPARAVVDAAAESIRIYSRYFGSYPYDHLTIAQNAYRGAMEYSGLISMSGSAFATYNEHPLSSLVTLTAHEIAHQWWYGAVGNDQVHEPWLDESLAKYSEVLFYEQAYPELVSDWWRLHIATASAKGPLNRSIYAFDDTPTYIREIYSQGALFVADIRQLLGDAAFFDFLSAYRQLGEGRLVTQEDFTRVLAAYAPSGDLELLLSIYFDDPEPSLEQNPSIRRP